MVRHGSALICGATMVTPTQTAIGDLRISDGVISEILFGGGLLPSDDELLIDGTGASFTSRRNRPSMPL